MKYDITKQDLYKRNFGCSFDFVIDRFLLFIEKEKQENNPFFSADNIKRIETKTIKRINYGIYIYGYLGLLSLFYGLYVFISFEPRIAVSLYTHFPYIANGSIAIVLGISFFSGCLYSYFKRDAVLVAKVKTKIIEQMQKEQEKKNAALFTKPSKKRRRFRQKFTGHKRKKL